MIDLKGKVSGIRVASGGGQERLVEVSVPDDLIDSLVALGYSEREVYAHVNKIDREASLQNQIKQMLGMLGKN